MKCQIFHFDVELKSWMSNSKLRRCQIQNFDIKYENQEKFETRRSFILWKRPCINPWEGEGISLYPPITNTPWVFFAASFLIPYGIMLALEGIPLYYMELCIGQRMRKGSVGVWNEISPYLGGVGIASVMVCFLVSLYYNVIIARCVFYFFKSFQNPLPWSECPLEPVTFGNVTRMKPVNECENTSPTKYFWYRTTLQISTGIEDSGGINWKLYACLTGTWILIWLCMMKGIRITGKVRLILQQQ